jgi:hypothetical protein
MLIVLHEKINSIVPIHGISDNGDGTYRVDYVSEPTEEQIVLVNKAIEDFPLSLAKEAKLKQIEVEWAEVEKTGWDSGKGYHLGITPSDVALLVGVFSLAKEAAALGMPLPGLISMENNTIEFETIQDMTVLLMNYGKARSDMAKAFAARRKAVEDATMIEEIPVI